LRPSTIQNPVNTIKTSIDTSSPILIRGQNPILLSSSPIQASFGISGLRNLGNTCFMNSVIQCLSATTPFARYFLGGYYRRHISRNNPLSSNGRVAEAYASLIQSMWSGDESVVNPSRFKAIAGDLHPSFSGNEQQDSQEFLSFLLDQLHEDLNIARRPFPSNGPDLDSEDFSELDFMKIETKKYHDRNWSIVVDMFQGILKSVVECLSCRKVVLFLNRRQPHITNFNT
jgi:ubiquitin carboxyl-terminal hydrolase 8